MPDLSGKVMIVTGGNAGIGYETVKVCTAFPEQMGSVDQVPVLGTGATHAQRQGLHGISDTGESASGD